MRLYQYIPVNPKWIIIIIIGKGPVTHQQPGTSPATQFFGSLGCSQTIGKMAGNKSSNTLYPNISKPSWCKIIAKSPRCLIQKWGSSYKFPLHPVVCSPSAWPSAHSTWRRTPCIRRPHARPWVEGGSEDYYIYICILYLYTYVIWGWMFKKYAQLPLWIDTGIYIYICMYVICVCNMFVCDMCV